MRRDLSWFLIVCVILRSSHSFLSLSDFSSPEPLLIFNLTLVENLLALLSQATTSFNLFACVYFLFLQACGPQYGYMCGQQQYISGVCANVSSSFQILNSVAPGVQGMQLDKKRLIRTTRDVHKCTPVEDKR